MKSAEAVRCRGISRERRGDLRLPNEPFPVLGRLVPALKDGVWTYTEELLPEAREMCFPDEQYDYDALAEDHLFIGAYDDGDRCVGLAVLKEAWFRYMYVEDLKVCRAARGMGVGRRLLESAEAAARTRGYRGLYLIVQDDNLAAFRFYLKCGFAIGGYDNRVYRGTSQAGKGDVVMYRDFLEN